MGAEREKNERKSSQYFTEEVSTLSIFGSGEVSTAMFFPSLYYF